MQSKEPDVPHATSGSRDRSEEEVKELQTPAKGNKMLHKHTHSSVEI